MKHPGKRILEGERGSFSYNSTTSHHLGKSRQTPSSTSTAKNKETRGHPCCSMLLTLCHLPSCLSNPVTETWWGSAQVTGGVPRLHPSVGSLTSSSYAGNAPTHVLTGQTDLGDSPMEAFTPSTPNQTTPLHKHMLTPTRAHTVHPDPCSHPPPTPSLSEHIHMLLQLCLRQPPHRPQPITDWIF